MRRLAAISSLACVVVLTTVLTIVLWRNVGALVIGLAGLAIAVVGAWWIATERSARRTIGIVAAVVGLGVILVALIDALRDAEDALLWLALVVALAAGATAAARCALLREVDGAQASATTRRTPRKPVLLCNPWSGGGKVEKFGLVELAGQLGVEVVMLDHGLDLEQLARTAVADGADCLGMAGGDGSQALVASIAIEHELPFVCVTAGTRNHFALDLGLDREDPRASMAAFTDAVERRVDYATVNGRLFVNNVSLGVYATVVQEDEYRDAKAATFSSVLPQLLGADAKPFDLQFTDPSRGETDGAFLILVSNNPYVIGTRLDNFQRRALDGGALGVVAVSTPDAQAAAKLITASAKGLRRHNPHWHEFTTNRFEIRSRSGAAFVGVDGEALEMTTPLVFETHPGALRLLVPEGNRTAAEQRRARGVRVGDLANVALGRSTEDIRDRSAGA